MGLFDIFRAYVSDWNAFSWQNVVLLSVGLFWLVFASIEDFRRREVENWWTFSLIIFVLIFRLLFSIETSEWDFIIWGLLGLVGGFIVAEVFYYSRMFAGGDAKMLMALGTILFLSYDWRINLFLLLAYLLLFVVCGSIYGLVYSIILSIRYKKDFKKAFSRLFKEFKRTIILVEFIFLITLGLSVYFNFQIGVFLSALLFVSPLLLVFAKALEESCMKVSVKTSDLTIGDWLAAPLKIKGKKIEPYWEGLGEKELAYIQKSYSGRVLVKQGLPFIPAFLFALIVFIILLSLL
jgi:Flp pilus assembly protein protease CpaA